MSRGTGVSEAKDSNVQWFPLTNDPELKPLGILVGFELHWMEHSADIGGLYLKKGNQTYPGYSLCFYVHPAPGAIPLYHNDQLKLSIYSMEGVVKPPYSPENFTKEDVLEAGFTYAKIIAQLGLSPLCAMGFSSRRVSPGETIHGLPIWERKYILSVFRETLGKVLFDRFVQRVTELCVKEFIADSSVHQVMGTLAYNLREPPFYLGDQKPIPYPRGRGENWFGLVPFFGFNTQAKSITTLLIWGFGGMEWAGSLKELPPAISTLRDLEVLDLGDNRLSFISKEIGSLIKLKELRLAHNKITGLPPELSQLQGIKRLDLGENQITVLPSFLDSYKSVEHLDVYYNPLRFFPNSVLALEGLKFLNVSACALTELPDAFGKLPKLQIFLCDKNNITTLPPSIFLLSKLQEFSLNQNKLTTIPEQLSQLRSLIVLDLGKNPLGSFPNSILQLEKLEDLNLSATGITEIPSGISKLRNLQTLDIRRNKLTSIPESLAEIPHLHTLIVSSNKLQTIPSFLQQMTSLKTLDTSCNPLGADKN